MEYSGPMKGSVPVRELAKVAHVLREMDSRRSFVDDPKSALQRAGVDMAAIPESVIDTLAEMSPDELGAVIRFNDALVNAGFVAEMPDVNGGTVGIF